MKKYTENEIRKILDDVDYEFNFSWGQLFKTAFWSMFNRRRLNILCDSLSRGKSIYLSFKDASV